jgi:hypothetical protein
LTYKLDCKLKYKLMYMNTVDKMGISKYGVSYFTKIKMNKIKVNKKYKNLI